MVKFACVVFTAKHAEPIRDQWPRWPLYPFTTVDTVVQPGFNAPLRVCWRDRAHAHGEEG